MQIRRNRYYNNILRSLLLKVKRISRVTWMYVITLTCMQLLILKHSSNTNRKLRNTNLHNTRHAQGHRHGHRIQTVKEYIELDSINNDYSSSLLPLGKAFQPWGNEDTPFPCFPGYSNINKKGSQLKGLIYVRIHKSSSSTLAGINLRIATNKNHKEDRCACTWDHVPAQDVDIPNRDRSTTILWSFVRDPAKRFVSDFFYFSVSRRGYDPDAKIFNITVKKRPIKSSNYQVRFLHPDILPIQISKKNKDQPMLIQNATIQVQQILQEYDFIGVTERFDESIVALQLLLHLDVHDILSLHTNKGGGYDSVKDEFGSRCFRIQKSYLTPDMIKYFKSNDWYKQNAGDYLLHQAANRSLDLTIEKTIGRDIFDAALAKYLYYKGKLKVCEETVVFPCSENGELNRSAAWQNCYYDDLGCGYPCLNTIV